MASNSRGSEPIAILGFACRLPGGSQSPQQLWDFLEQGHIADNTAPASRFNIKSHYDGSLKPKTMRQPGGMFLQNSDLADFDAGFFEVGSQEATAMDPNQRYMLEVVYECMENAGISIDSMDSKPVGCYVGSFSSDYADMANRDPEDRPLGVSLGVARTVLANRLSHFLNVKGPSVTLDTACSGSLVGLDFASKALRLGTIDMGIVATSNLYMSPEHVIDVGSQKGAHSPSALCHTFDAKADGYCKAEAVAAVIVKRLSDAVRDRDPIRAVVLGTAQNHNGRTPGIASPNSQAQALAIRAAYADAGISDFNQTAFLECHGTGTQAGDANEVDGAGSVFAPTRSSLNPLIIGSIKSNVGHSEPSAGLSGLMKAVMAIEKGVIPGNPTFIDPSPKINFAGNKVKATRALIPWPENALRRASINSFGIGGSNAHAVVEAAQAQDCMNHVSSYADGKSSSEGEESHRPYCLILSANDAASLQANVRALCTHLINPRVKVDLAELAYTLSERRTRLFHRAFVTTRGTELNENIFTMTKKLSSQPKIAFVFTGQGAQWPEMGKELLETFPWILKILEELDQVLQSQPDPPQWSLISELTENRSSKHMRQPEVSQPLVTALQLCLMAVLESWAIKPSSVVGHSSGECAAAYAAGWLSRAGALKAAFYRGQAAKNCRLKSSDGELGMLAVGLGADAVEPYLQKYAGDAAIACFNSPNSLTISGRKSTLNSLAEEIKADGHFARALLVDLAYHSRFMNEIGEEYLKLLDDDAAFEPLDGSSSGVKMYSSVTTKTQDQPTTASYWKSNMVSPVRFDSGLTTLVTTESPNIIVELGPAGALAGPISQVLKSLPKGSDVSYCAAWARGANASKSLVDVAGHLFAMGASIDMAVVNDYNSSLRTIIDLPNYSWNHSIKYWHESASSKDWRFKKFPVHDLLGSKVLGAPWQNPVWRNRLNAGNVPWILDHQMGGSAIMPAAGFMTLGLEALYQKHVATSNDETVPKINDLCWRFRNVRFNRALVLEQGKDAMLMLTLNQIRAGEWHEFHVSTTTDVGVIEHCSGLVRIQDEADEQEGNITPLRNAHSAKGWYKVKRDTGMEFGPAFQKLLKVEATAGVRACRTLLSLAAPNGPFSPQSYYPVHPAALDGCLQSPIPANAIGERINVRDVMIPALIDEVIINPVRSDLNEGISNAESVYSGRGRLDQDKSWIANTSVYDSETGKLAVRMTGVNYVKLDVPPRPDPHTLTRVQWDPDVSLLTQDQILCLPDGEAGDRLQRIIDLIAYRKPALAVLEVSLDDANETSLWFDNGGNAAIRSGYSRYDFGAVHGKSLIAIQSKHESQGRSTFVVAKLENESLGLETGALYDLVIYRSATGQRVASMNALLLQLKPLLNQHAFILAVGGSVNEGKTGAQSSKEFSNSDGEEVSSQSGTPDSISQNLSDASDGNTTSSSIDSAAWDQMAAKSTAAKVRKPRRIETTKSILEIPSQTFNAYSSVIHQYSGVDPSQLKKKNLVIASICDDLNFQLGPSLRRRLKKSGWSLSHQSAPFSRPSKDDVVVILDELSRPVLRNVTEKQWESIKLLASSGQPLLWVTKGTQVAATNPDTALVYGLFRVAGREDDSLNLTILDVQSNTSLATEYAIDQVLNKLATGEPTETQYMERDGILHIQRVLPDEPINAFKRAETEGLEPGLKSLHSNEAQVQLRAERLGTFDGLTWCETAEGEDVAITMGIVPDNEYTIGLECAGIVTRLGPGASHFKIGDRVCMLWRGTYANRIQVHQDRCHVIPDWMSFEQGATLPSVYLCSLFALYHLAGLQEGRSVLIHSATGGVGIACLELAKHKKAEIYVTVGTEEKRRFLETHYDIPRNRMFSSRNAKFAAEIMRETNGRGVDVVVNSLVGELLDASWRIVADGGTMVEIGKKDIVDRNTLAMEPFDRNCSFRAVDFSYIRHINEALVSKLFAELFELINNGYIKPIHPITTFGFDDVPAALSHIRAGRHMGKIVITRLPGEDVQVPIRPAVRPLKLDSEVSYLIIGGLKGACGTLAIHMAQHGARHIVVGNRSGISDEASAAIVEGCATYGCTVVEARGDVGDYDWVQNLVKTTMPRLAGVIQGAMVIRDTPYELMTVEDFRTSLHAKVTGTWNLHKATTEFLKQPLDFFTLLSSLSGFIGKEGQGNYAAANSFLDSFASYRQQHGLCANSIDIGAIEDVGYVAEDSNGLENKINWTQWIAIKESTLRQLLTYSILQQDRASPINKQSTTQLIAGIAYPFPNDGSHTTREPRFSHLCAARGEGNTSISNDEGDQTGLAIRALHTLQKSGEDEATLTKAVTDILSSQFAKILGLSEEVEPGKALMAYGLDSLSAVELRNWTRQKFSVELSTLDIINATSLIELSGKVVGKLPEVV
ncbi:beta-ketoacyl synthase domain-containing protein [Cadophora sp. MPI-SDFR-AT-0126]|nr:beta-ketoacyl synthase domain-containing protein [Leotiomycetes sp. MPI-SDFR-AT-0126]